MLTAPGQRDEQLAAHDLVPVDVGDELDHGAEQGAGPPHLPRHVETLQLAALLAGPQAEAGHQVRIMLTLGPYLSDILGYFLVMSSNMPSISEYSV